MNDQRFDDDDDDVTHAVKSARESLQQNVRQSFSFSLSRLFFLFFQFGYFTFMIHLNHKITNLKRLFFLFLCLSHVFFSPFEHRIENIDSFLSLERS